MWERLRGEFLKEDVSLVHWSLAYESKVSRQLSIEMGEFSQVEVSRAVESQSASANTSASTRSLLLAAAVLWVLLKRR